MASEDLAQMADRLLKDLARLQILVQKV